MDSRGTLLRCKRAIRDYYTVVLTYLTIMLFWGQILVTKFMYLKKNELEKKLYKLNFLSYLINGEYNDFTADTLKKFVFYFWYVFATENRQRVSLFVGSLRKICLVDYNSGFVTENKISILLKKHLK